MSKGQRIKARREQLNIPQTELANKISVSKQTLYKYENDIVTNIPSDKIELLAKELDTTPAYIMGWETEDGEATPELMILNAYVSSEKAKELFNLYQTASPEVRAAVDLLLKSSRSDP